MTEFHQVGPDPDTDVEGEGPARTLLERRSVQAPGASRRRLAATAAAAAAALLLAVAAVGYHASASSTQAAASNLAAGRLVRAEAKGRAAASRVDLCERCPAGSCERQEGSESPCTWFESDGSHHCRVETCDDVPKGKSISKCWQYNSTNFFSYAVPDAPCADRDGREEAKEGREHEHKPTCEAYGCHEKFRPWQPCQCNEACKEFRSCCSDYRDVCLATKTKTTTTKKTTTETKTTTLPSLFDVEALSIRTVAVKYDNPKLQAYWDSGDCGLSEDDNHAEWCGGLTYKPDCREVVDVHESVCASGKASLKSVRGGEDNGGNLWIHGCTYMYFAQYGCMPTTTTTRTSTTETSTTRTSTTTTTTTTSTFTGTSTTKTSTSSTRTVTTSTTSTTTPPPGTCYPPVLGPDVDTSACHGVYPPWGSCKVRCPAHCSGEAKTFFCRAEDDGFEGEAPNCTCTTTLTSTTSTTTTTTTTTGAKTTVPYMERMLLLDLHQYTKSLRGADGAWKEDAGFSPRCTDKFQLPSAPQWANDLNGIKIPDTCFEEDKAHRVYIIGDWGGLLAEDGPKPANQRSKEDFLKGVDDSAQQRVAGQMGERAKTRPPDYVINAGDNFYWSGINTACGIPAYNIVPTGQFENNFEKVYTGEGLEGKPWLGVLGNHDYGGFRFNAGWDQLIAYSWSNGGPAAKGRWVMPAQFYSSTVRYPGFSVDYFFLDTNHFNAQDPHGDAEHNICSQEHVEESTGCGVQGPKDVWDCPNWFGKLWDAQKPWIEDGLKKSKADWQIVVTHFPPTWGQGMWMRLAKEYGIDLFITGHMHSQEFFGDGPGNFLHPTAWVVSGGGGGITSEGDPTHDGHDDQYGFFEMTLTKEQLEIQSISHGGFVRRTGFVKPRGRGVAHTHGDHVPPESAQGENHESFAHHRHHHGHGHGHGGHKQAGQEGRESEATCEAYGCHQEFRSWQTCQCNEDCDKFSSCCPDYRGACPAAKTGTAAAKTETDVGMEKTDTETKELIFKKRKL